MITDNEMVVTGWWGSSFVIYIRTMPNHWSGGKWHMLSQNPSDSTLFHPNLALLPDDVEYINRSIPTMTCSDFSNAVYDVRIAETDLVSLFIMSKGDLSKVF